MNYLRWKFVSDSGPKHSMTNLMMLTGTTSNPIQDIVIDNPNPNSIVVIDVLITALTTDNLNDVVAFIYLQNLTFDKVHTFNETTTSVLAFFDQDDILAGTINFNDINNITRIPGLNRIIITELGNDNNIILDFTDESNMLQALSAINWVLLDGSTRFLPQPEDNLAPVITYTNLIVSNTLEVDLTTFGFSYNKQHFINNTIATVIDARDGIIIPSISSITISQTINNQIIYYNIITQAGTYNATISITDIAGNIITHSITIDAQNIIIDTTAPVITYTSNVTGLVIAPFDINITPTGFTHNDALVYCISSVTDNLDNIIPLSSISVSFYDVNMILIPTITQEGNYNIIFSVSDVHNNVTTDALTFNMTNPLIDSAPEIQFNITNVNVQTMTASISLAVFIGTFTKVNAIAQFITQVVDDIDGIITLNSSNITFINNLLLPIGSITSIGNYTVIITV